MWKNSNWSVHVQKTHHCNVGNKSARFTSQLEVGLQFAYRLRSFERSKSVKTSVINLCAKVFDRLNHDGLFINLMLRFIPATLLNVLKKWLGISYTYVSWNSAYSHMFKLTSGVRRGGVLSPYLFAAYIDDLINHVHSKQIGSMYNFVNACIVMYADDIVVSPVSSLISNSGVCLWINAWSIGFCYQCQEKCLYQDWSSVPF